MFQENPHDLVKWWWYTAHLATTERRPDRLELDSLRLWLSICITVIEYHTRLLSTRRVYYATLSFVWARSGGVVMRGQFRSNHFLAFGTSP